MIEGRRCLLLMTQFLALSLAFSSVLACSDDDLDGSESAALGSSSDDDNSSDDDIDGGVECTDIDERDTCLTSQGCFYREGDDSCVSDDGSDGPLCLSKVPCSGSEDIDLCGDGGDCCSMSYAVQEVDIDLASGMGDGCIEPTSDAIVRRELCVPSDVKHGDTYFANPHFAAFDENGEPRLLRIHRKIYDFEESGLYYCGDLPDDTPSTLEDLCDEYSVC